MSTSAEIRKGCPAQESNMCIKTAKEFNMKEFVRPDMPSNCTWTRDADPKSSPHSKIRINHTNAVLPNILHTIGNTPLIKLNNIPKSFGIKCNIFAKCEFFNPGGSVKDRIGFRMVEDAEKNGTLKPGYTIIEPTSGNTGIGLALASAVKGYRCIIVMPEKMSNEKVDVLRALGAEIIRTPTAAAFDSPEGLIAVSQKLQKEIPNSIVLDQYRNAGNPLAHYDTTAAEIVESLDGKVDMVVGGTGTGGTISGVGRLLKEKCPNCVVVAADPLGSILALPESLNKTDVSFYEVEGIGYDFIPTVLDRSIVDVWIKINDLESLPMAKRIIKEEGLLCGGSSGSALVAALQAASSLEENQNCVVILPDGIRNYMTKFVSDQWMESRNLKSCVNTQNHWWWNKTVSELLLQMPVNIPASATCLEALNLMKKQGVDQLPVIDNNRKLEGVASTSHLLSKLLNSPVKSNDLITKALVNKFSKVRRDSHLGLVSRILEKESFVLVTEGDFPNEEVVGVITNIHILDYITGKEAENGQ